MPFSPLKQLKKLQQQSKKQGILIDGLTILQFKQQLKKIEDLIEGLNGQKYFSWKISNNQINDQLLTKDKIKQLTKSFERKYCEQLHLLRDFYSRNYRRSLFICCFFLCSDSFRGSHKKYPFVEQSFECAISNLNSSERNIFFYLNLVYLKLYLMLTQVDKLVKQQFNKKMIEAIHVQSKQKKQIDQRKQEVGQLQQIKDVFVLIQDAKINKNEQQQNFHSYPVQSDNPMSNLFKNRQVESRQPFDSKLIHTNCYDQLKQLKDEIKKINSKDWQRILKIEQWSSLSLFGFIQINNNQPIKTVLEFADCKIKTKYFFDNISSNSFDLRGFLIKKQKKKNGQYAMYPIYDNNITFNLKFWLADEELKGQNKQKNQAYIQKFLLTVMRISIKQKIDRMAKIKMRKWMIRNVVHAQPVQQRTQRQTSFQSIQQSSHDYNDTFWWVNLGQKLVHSMVQVAKKKAQSIRHPRHFIKPTRQYIKHNVNKSQFNNPQANEYLGESSKPFKTKGKLQSSQNI